MKTESRSDKGRSRLLLAVIAVAALLLGGASARPHHESAPVQTQHVLQATTAEHSPAYASSAGAQATSALFLARIVQSPSAQAIEAQRRTPIIATGIVWPVAVAAMRAELSFRCDLIAAKCGRPAFLKTTIPPPLT